MAKMIRAARHYQKPDSAVAALAVKGQRAVKREMKEALAQLGELIPRERAIRQARAADWAGVRLLVSWGHFQETLKGPLGRLILLRHDGAALAVRKINGAFAQARRAVRFRKVEVIDKAVGDRFNFDLYDEPTLRRIRAAQDALIRELDAEARRTINTVISSSARRGLGPEAIVDDIRENIGLTARQAQAVLNYEDLLRSLDAQALERRLRNGQYDDALIEAIESGDSLSEAAIARMVDDYRENYLDYRAETIAQSESVRAVNAGLQDAYQQAIDRVALPEEAIRQFWQLGDRPCPVCESIPDRNPDGVAIGETFDSSEGQQVAPPVHPNCNCSLEIVTDLDKVPAEEVAA